MSLKFIIKQLLSTSCYIVSSLVELMCPNLYQLSWSNNCCVSICHAFLFEFVYLLEHWSPRHTESSSWVLLLSSLCLPRRFLSLIFTSLRGFLDGLGFKAQKVYSKLCVCHLGDIYFVLLPKVSIFQKTQDLAQSTTSWIAEHTSVVCSAPHHSRGSIPFIR